MASPKFNSNSYNVKRILREASELTSSPSPDYHASPASDSNLFEWHFTLRGPPSSPFASGIYHGRIVLPPTYPLRPPSFRFLTPSGRFETNREICLSISGHHEETWQPAWGIRTALVALRAFMETDAKGQLGGLDTSDAIKKKCAESSGSWKCGTCGKSNAEVLKECEDAARLKEEVEGKGSTVDEKIPEGLVIGSREDLGLTSPAGEGEDTEAELAEGFVQTTPVVQNPYPSAQPGQSVPRPTGSQPLPSANAEQNYPPTPTRTVTARRAQVQQHVSDEGVPIWVDRAIAGIVICLVALILKMLFGR